MYVPQGCPVRVYIFRLVTATDRQIQCMSKLLEEYTSATIRKGDNDYPKWWNIQITMKVPSNEKQRWTCKRFCLSFLVVLFAKVPLWAFCCLLSYFSFEQLDVFCYIKSGLFPGNSNSSETSLETSWVAGVCCFLFPLFFFRTRKLFTIDSSAETLTL